KIRNTETIIKKLKEYYENAKEKAYEKERIILEYLTRAYKDSIQKGYDIIIHDRCTYGMIPFIKEQRKRNWITKEQQEKLIKGIQETAFMFRTAEVYQIWLTREQNLERYMGTE